MTTVDDDIDAISRIHASRVRGDGFDQCRTRSIRLAKAIVKSGRDARVLRMQGFRGAWTGAHPKWIAMGNPGWWVHYVVEVVEDGTVIDVTARQFDPSAESPAYAGRAEIEDLWDEIEILRT